MASHRVRDTSLPFDKRRAAFVTCVVRYKALTGGAANECMAFYEREFRFDEDCLDADERLLAALKHLETEHNKALHELHQREIKNVRQKERKKQR